MPKHQFHSTHFKLTTIPSFFTKPTQFLTAKDNNSNHGSHFISSRQLLQTATSGKAQLLSLPCQLADSTIQGCLFPPYGSHIFINGADDSVHEVGPGDSDPCQLMFLYSYLVIGWCWSISVEVRPREHATSVPAYA
ncbi:hypothetical protein CFOL_v3_24337 [Cephalotus follicularis]|uniref:Uncharacterized protein n=1 Tax=Cephalotus follicularis TaxID=3775 RepID=A0A1Q3CLD6_CEPFO|nr:hypothetical protein CFOL_v3_24337 [Cephalotus follicularis]